MRRFRQCNTARPPGQKVVVYRAIDDRYTWLGTPSADGIDASCGAADQGPAGAVVLHSGQGGCRGFGTATVRRVPLLIVLPTINFRNGE